MRLRTNRRVVAWGVAVSVFAAALAFALAPMLSGAAAEPAIDTAAPVSPDQCAACHLDLSNVDVPGLVFSHGNHLLVSCDGCHARMPHRADATERVPMEVCFACHGVYHGPQGELATGVCEDCHTPSFELRPKSHTKEWAKEPHAEAGKASGVNGCMMCHDAPKDCDSCHADEAPDAPKMPAAYHSIITERPRGPSVKVYPKGPVSMSQCVYCHTDVDDVVPGRLIFAHAYHLQRNYRCESCHEVFPHNPDATKKPDMASCYRCHGLNHNSAGQVAVEDCDACHPKQFDLMPPDHTKTFIRKSHAKRADADPAYCAMCHKSSFCVGCHRGEKVSPNAPGYMIIPGDHRKASWMKAHGPLYLDGDGACGSCHDDPSCKRCHKTVMPHPTGWITKHTPEPGVTREDCGVCHQERGSCQECHHSKVWRERLTEKNCTPCHPEMKQKPATAIKHKAFAEHAVHFDVDKIDSEYRKAKPYGCYECHIDFGTSAAAREIELQQGHDLRLCYECHGANDPFNELIAPWKGSSLCLRCHTDLNI